MLRNFKFSLSKTPAGIAQAGLGLLLLCNVVAVWFAIFPPGGSPKELEQQILELRSQLVQKAALLKQTGVNVHKIERGRSEGDQFMASYFLGLRTASSALVEELSRAAKDAKITPKEHSVQTEEIEGSDNLRMMTINGNYEGTYADLIQFINRLDRSQGLLIIESLNAAPQQGKDLLNINLKMDTFVRDEAGQ